MTKPIPINRTIHTPCPNCGHRQPVALTPQADDQPVNCSECGAHICTMGEMMDAVWKAVCERLGAGLERRLEKAKRTNGHAGLLSLNGE